MRFKTVCYSNNNKLSSEKYQRQCNHQDLRGPRKETLTANYLSFHLELNATLIRYAGVNLRRRKRW